MAYKIPTKWFAQNAHRISSGTQQKEHKLKKTVSLSCPYTERQWKILNNEIPLDKVRLTELNRLLCKAKEREEPQWIDTAEALYEQKKNPDNYQPPYTKESAASILASLNYPWVRELEAKIRLGEKIVSDEPMPSIEHNCAEFGPKEVEQYTPTGIFVRKYDSVSAAARQLGFGANSIYVAARTGKVCNGFIWKYTNDPNETK